jgi:predicted SpoU family rRNA methylase
MNSFTANRLRKTALKMRQSLAGARVTLRWISADSGAYDEYRDEYDESGTETFIEFKDVPSLIYEITGWAIAVGNWGDAQVGDLIVAVDSSFDLSEMRRPRIIYNNIEYMIIPNSTIPMTRISGIVADKSLSRVYHCRYMGKKAGTI